MKSSQAISLFERPASINLATSSSRSVSEDSTADCREALIAANRPRMLAAIRGEQEHLVLCHVLDGGHHPGDGRAASHVA